MGTVGKIPRSVPTPFNGGNPSLDTQQGPYESVCTCKWRGMGACIRACMCVYVEEGGWGGGSCVKVEGVVCVR